MPAPKGNKLSLYSPVRHLKGVGPQVEQRLAKLQLFTLQDLLLHLPTRYQNRTTLIPISKLLQETQNGQATEAQISGKIVSTQVSRSKHAPSRLTLSDDTGTIDICLFNLSKHHIQQYKPGAYLLAFGLPTLFRDTLQMVHPDLEHKSTNDFDLPDRLSPIYASTAKLPQKTLAKLIRFALSSCEFEAISIDLLPQDCYTAFGLSPLLNILNELHFPKPNEDLQTLKQQLSLEELITHHWRMLDIHHQRIRSKGPRIQQHAEQIEAFKQQLPFALTDDQQQATADILNDLCHPHQIPMLRLVQGDVGSGKTVVAAIASLPVIHSGFQVALMAPTELLAHQHYQAFSAWFAPSEKMTVALLTSQTKTSERKEILNQLATGETTLLIGTHAIYQSDIHFKRLGLTIIDEQHRFGVEQRKALNNKCGHPDLEPHQLILTATPIPRTLMMSLYSAMDASQIKQLPAGRLPIITASMVNTKREAIISRVQQAISEGQQVYWVCRLINTADSTVDIDGINEPSNANSNNNEIASVQLISDLLTTSLPNTTIEQLHGKMPAQEKQQAIERFKRKESMILVATTVIEVGINIPNASIMIIEDAHCFGLAQLHQLRGRVGRGNQQSYCILLYQSQLTAMGQARLSAIRNCHNGFDIAEQDLTLRGPGEVLGTEQAGAIRFKVADINKDKILLDKVKRITTWLFNNDSEHTLYKLSQRWLRHSE